MLSAYSRRIKRVHFIGIGGTGMSGIAEVMKNLGYEVTGSDIKRSYTTERLEKLGCKIFYGHKRENVQGANVVVYSSAIKGDNVEMIEAYRLGIPVIPRAEMLAELMRFREGILVAGSHGKTTTTSLISSVLSAGGLDPTSVIGGRFENIGTGGKLGSGEFFVAEADESDGSFLRLQPTIAVVTNIDPEHLDYYGSFENLIRSFRSFVEKVPFYGLSIICGDHPVTSSLTSMLSRRYWTYGLEERNTVSGRIVESSPGLMKMDVLFHGRHLGRVELPLWGRHNAVNALAAISVGLEVGVAFNDIKEGLSSFKGVKRRFEIKGKVKGIIFVDDYGHHPEEIKATLSAAREFWEGRIAVVFQPHRFTRTKLLFEELASSFHKADRIYLMEIYPAGETPIPGVSSHSLHNRMREIYGEKTFYSPHWDEIKKKITEGLKPGDMLLTLGAGDVWKLGEEIMEEIS